MATTWNLSNLYNSETDPQIQKDIETSSSNVQAFIEKWKDTEGYLKDPAILKVALDEYENLHSTTGICDKPLYYFILRNNLDQTDPDIKARLNKISDICTKLENDIQFFELNISKIPKEDQPLFLEYTELEEYKHFLEQLFLSSKYLLTDKEEKIFNLTGKTSYSNPVGI